MKQTTEHKHLDRERLSRSKLTSKSSWFGSEVTFDEPIPLDDEPHAIADDLLLIYKRIMMNKGTEFEEDKKAYKGWYQFYQDSSLTDLTFKKHD
jgi:hypothetical protein